MRLIHLCLVRNNLLNVTDLPAASIHKADLISFDFPDRFHRILLVEVQTAVHLDPDLCHGWCWQLLAYLPVRKAIRFSLRQASNDLRIIHLNLIQLILILRHLHIAFF